MADTKSQKNAENWIVRCFLPERYDGLEFEEKKVSLIWGGSFAFDAVSADQSIIGLVSTSAARTPSGKLGTAKIQKIKCDTLYLTNTKSPCRKILIFSEKSMFEHFQKEADAGRFPKEVELMYAKLPEEIQKLVLNAREVAQSEVMPSGSDQSSKA